MTKSSKPEWMPDVRAAGRQILTLPTIRLYVWPEDGGWHFSVAGQFLLRHTRKPLATEHEAKFKAKRAAIKFLYEEINRLETL